MGFSGDGGPALDATFRFIESIALDPAGNLFIADAENCRIRRVDHQTGVVNTVAITGDSKQECPPRPGTNPPLPTPDDLAVGPDGNVYFLEPAMNVVVQLFKDWVGAAVFFFIPGLLSTRGQRRMCGASLSAAEKHGGSTMSRWGRLR